MKEAQTHLWRLRLAIGGALAVMGIALGKESLSPAQGEALAWASAALAIGCLDYYLVWSAERLLLPLVAHVILSIGYIVGVVRGLSLLIQEASPFADLVFQAAVYACTVVVVVVSVSQAGVRVREWRAARGGKAQTSPLRQRRARI